MQSDVSTYLVGLFLRFGVPLGLTLFLAWLLKNLDIQWLEETNGEVKDEKLNFSYPLEGCWILDNLSSSNSLSGDPEEACWKVRMNFEGALPDKCLECKYFQEGHLENAA